MYQEMIQNLPQEIREAIYERMVFKLTKVMDDCREKDERNAERQNAQHQATQRQSAHRHNDNPTQRKDKKRKM